MVYRFFSGDFPITIALYLIMWLWAFRRRSLIRDLMFGDAPIWNRIGQVTLGIAALFPLWVALADNWRQLLGYTLSQEDRWKSDPFLTTATPDVLRYLTLGLLAALVVGVALLHARRRGPVGLLVMSAVFALIFFYIFNPLRMRVDVLMVSTSDSLNGLKPLDVGFIVFWASGLYLLIALLIAALLIVVETAVALPVRLVYWLATRGRAQQEAEIFSVYRVRARVLEATGPSHGRIVRRNPPSSEQDGKPR